MEYNKWIYKDGFISDIPSGAFGFIYVIRYPNGKIYVGKKHFYTTENGKERMSDWKRYFGGGTSVKRYMKEKKPDKKSIQRFMLEIYYDLDSLLEAEKIIIEQCNAVESSRYFNNARGGTLGNTGWHHSPESKAKIRNANLGNKNSVGRTMSEETKQALIKANTGRKISEETRQRMSVARKGIPMSMQTKERMKIGQRKRREREWNEWLAVDHTWNPKEQKADELEWDKIISWQEEMND